MEDKAKAKIYGANKTEAWADAESYEPVTNINIPHEVAVENAKDWVDDNEL